MWLLTLAIVAVIAGVLMLPLVRRRGAWLSGLDGFVAVFVGGIVALHILPESVVHGGRWAVVAAALGLGAPLAMHWLVGRQGCDAPRSARGRWMLITVAALAVACHAAVDGIALASVTGHADHGGHAAHELHAAGGQALAIAVIAHRLPTGLSLGWIVERVAHMRGALAAAAGVGLATVLGFVAGRAGLIGHEAAALAVLQAAVAGTLLHVVTGHATPARLSRRASRRGLLAGGATACALLAAFVLDAALAPLALLALAPLWVATRHAPPGASDSAESPMPALSAVAAAVSSDVD